MKSREGIVEEECDSLHIKIGGEIIPGLFASIRKATSERREYGTRNISRSINMV